MNVEELRECCLLVKGASESFPFDDKILVFKVMGKMFAYIGLEPKDGIFFVNLKCNPSKAIELREIYEGVKRGYHTTGITWNSVYIKSDVPDSLIREMIRHSVDEVIKKLPQYKQAEYNNNVD